MGRIYDSQKGFNDAKDDAAFLASRTRDHGNCCLLLSVRVAEHGVFGRKALGGRLGTIYRWVSRTIRRGNLRTDLDDPTTGFPRGKDPVDVSRRCRYLLDAIASGAISPLQFRLGDSDAVRSTESWFL